MPSEDTRNKAVSNDAKPAPASRDTDAIKQDNAEKPPEIGGREGPDPTRYGDWEKAGRCIDF